METNFENIIYRPDRQLATIPSHIFSEKTRLKMHCLPYTLHMDVYLSTTFESESRDNSALLIYLFCVSFRHIMVTQQNMYSHIQTYHRQYSACAGKCVSTSLVQIIRD